MESSIIALLIFLFSLSTCSGIVIQDNESETSRLQALLQDRNQNLETLKGRLQLILTFLQEEKALLETTDAALPKIVSKLIRRPNQRNLRLQRVLNVGLQLSKTNRVRRSEEDSSEERFFNTQMSFAERLQNRRNREVARLRSLLQLRAQNILAFINRVKQLLSSVEEKMALVNFALENLSVLVNNLISGAPGGRIDFQALLAAALELQAQTTTVPTTMKSATTSSQQEVTTEIPTTTESMKSATMVMETTTSSSKPEVTTRSPALQQRIDEEINRLRQVLLRRIARLEFLVNRYRSPFLQNYYLAKLDFLYRTLDNLTILVTQLVTSPNQNRIRLSELLRASKNLPTVIINRRKRGAVAADQSADSVEDMATSEEIDDLMRRSATSEGMESSERKKRSASTENSESAEEINEMSLDDAQELLAGIITELNSLDSGAK